LPPLPPQFMPDPADDSAVQSGLETGAPPPLAVSIRDDEPVSLDFDEAPLPLVLKAFADLAGLDLLVADGVRGTVTLHLKRARWRHAFEALLDAHGLAMRRHGTLLWLSSAEHLTRRERRHADAANRLAEAEPLLSAGFELHYVRAEAARLLIAGSGNQRMLSRRGAATADARTNQLFVRDVAARLAQVRELIARVDRPTRQVLIEARIVEAEDGFSRNLGARLALLGTGAKPRGVSAPGSVPHGSGLKAENADSAGRTAEIDVGTPLATIAGSLGTLYNLPAGPLAGFGAAGAGLTLLAAGAQRVLALELSALEADGRGRIISSPRVVTADRIKALIEQGTELPYQARTGENVSGVQFRRAGLKLEVTPQVTPDGQVLLELDVTKDTVGATTLAGPAINTKHVRTQVQVESGGTVAIGGIYMEDRRTDVVAVPGLGSLPLIGALFQHRATSRTKSELIVFITPQVIAVPMRSYAGCSASAEGSRAGVSAQLAECLHSTNTAVSSLIRPT
jgi:type IV pilus assembly protein PilQ